MNAEQMELARRFAACKGWVWLPGMREASGCRVVAVDNADACLAEEGATCDDNHASWVPQCGCTPDLSDALTRAGLLEVVRRALGMPNLTPIIGADGWYLHGIPDDRPELWWSSGQPSELHALLAALEAAPDV